MAFYWCLDHGSVEGDQGCRAERRLGPFDTSGQASQALQTVAEREERYDAEDRAWRDGD